MLPRSVSFTTHGDWEQKDTILLLPADVTVDSSPFFGGMYTLLPPILSISPKMALKNELLPLPTEPTTATNEPRSIVQEMFFSVIRDSAVSCSSSTVLTDIPREAMDSARFNELVDGWFDPSFPKLLLLSSSSLSDSILSCFADARRSLRDMRFFLGGSIGVASGSTHEKDASWMMTAGSDGLSSSMNKPLSSSSSPSLLWRTVLPSAAGGNAGTT
mmetsp:Transcript_4996/g.11411  ORF Transcript_4996/g.11411 Transcript_4996/m.11411 type:complete len:216 (-) Transcript_4996:351-998(-)